MCPPQIDSLVRLPGDFFDRPFLVQREDKRPDRQPLLLLNRQAADLFPLVPLKSVVRFVHICFDVFKSLAVRFDIVLLEHALDQLAVHDRHRTEVNSVRIPANSSLHKQLIQLICELQGRQEEFRHIILLHEVFILVFLDFEYFVVGDGLNIGRFQTLLIIGHAVVHRKRQALLRHNLPVGIDESAGPRTGPGTGPLKARPRTGTIKPSSRPRPITSPRPGTAPL